MKLGLVFFAVPLFVSGQDRYTDYLNQLAQRQLAERKPVVAGITTEGQARKRMAESRAKVLRQIGGLPQFRAGVEGVPVFESPLQTFGEG